MAVMDVRVVRVAVHERLMHVRMRVWFGDGSAGFVLMLVMLVMDVAVRVDHSLVDVLVLVALRQM